MANTTLSTINKALMTEFFGVTYIYVQYPTKPCFYYGANYCPHIVISYVKLVRVNVNHSVILKLFVFEIKFCTCKEINTCIFTIRDTILTFE